MGFMCKINFLKLSSTGRTNNFHIQLSESKWTLSDFRERENLGDIQIA